MGPEVKIKISRAGVVTFEVDGVQGEGCERLTQQVHVLLGGGGKKETKPEYHMPANSSVGNELTF